MAHEWDLLPYPDYTLLLSRGQIWGKVWRHGCFRWYCKGLQGQRYAETMQQALDDSYKFFLAYLETKFTGRLVASTQS